MMHKCSSDINGDILSTSKIIRSYLWAQLIYKDLILSILSENFTFNLSLPLNGGREKIYITPRCSITNRDDMRRNNFPAISSRLGTKKSKVKNEEKSSTKFSGKLV